MQRSAAREGGGGGGVRGVHEGLYRRFGPSAQYGSHPRLPPQKPLCYRLAHHRPGSVGLEKTPMSVDAATVRRIAHLARIAVAEEEVAHLQGELNAILAFVEQLSEVDVAGVEPMTSVTPMEMKKRAGRGHRRRHPRRHRSRTRRRARTISSWCRKWWNEARPASAAAHCTILGRCPEGFREIKSRRGWRAGAGRHEGKAHVPRL